MKNEDIIAIKLKAGEVCQMDLNDCHEAFDLAKPTNSGLSMGEGAVIGAALMLSICLITGKCGVR